MRTIIKSSLLLKSIFLNVNSKFTREGLQKKLKRIILATNKNQPLRFNGLVTSLIIINNYD